MTSDNPGLIARVTTALRYAATGAMPTGWFGPGTPLPPQAPDDVRGRQFDYPTVYNVNVRPRTGEKVTFEALKRLATHPVVAMLLQRQKDKVATIDWRIVPVKVEANGSATAKADPMIQTITDFFKCPDKEHDWVQWVSGVLDQLMVIDAVTIYSAPTVIGGIYALQLLDGATIKPIIELGGRRPLAPSPAYQQILKGLPAVDYTSDELLYFPQVFRPDHVYGYSRVEQAYDLIEMAISRLKSQKGYFDYGNVGDGFFTAPTGWTPDMVKGLETTWNAMMQGDPGGRRNLPMLPDGVNFHETKAGMLVDTFDEFLIRLLCFPFGVAPQPFMKQTGMGHGSAGTEHDAAEEGGVAPLMQYVARLMTLIIGKWFKRPDLEFAFVEDREFDPQIKSTIEDQRIKNGTLTINQVLDRNGEAPIEGGDTPLLFAGSTWVTLDSVLNPPPPPEPIAPQPPVAPVGVNGADGGDSADNGTKTPPPPSLKKAADAGTQIHFKLVVASYLTAKAKNASDTICGPLKKSAMDDSSARFEPSFDDINWNWDDLPPLVQPFLASIAVAAGLDAVQELGSDLFDADTLARVSARATAYARDRGAELVGMKWDGDTLVVNPDAEWSISETTRNQLRNLVTKAMDEGQSNDQLRKAILESTTFSADRADTIARSETALADVRGAAAGWIESGVVHSAQFDASPDCCEDCQAEDGTIYPLAEPDDLDLPHPSCRCSFSAVLDDETGATDSQGDDENE